MSNENECIVCKAALLPRPEPPHCHDCVVTDEHSEEWEGRNKATGAGLEAVRADLATLREKARAVCEDAEPRRERPSVSLVRTDLIAPLRAELDKPSGTNVLAKLDAWKEYAQAIDFFMDSRISTSSTPEMLQRAADRGVAARARLNQLGIDPEAP